MIRISVCLLILFLTACSSNETPIDEIYINGKTDDSVNYLRIDTDTIWVKNGLFSDTLSRTFNQYNYLQLDTWKWPKIVHLARGENLNLNFQNEWTNVETNPINEFLLNKDSILSPYTARWNMADSTFRKVWQEEFPLNMTKIDQFFASVDIAPSYISEIKQMELMLRGHLTANFISFQERKGVSIDRDIYRFVDSIEFNNTRLGFHKNNRNFQYYYFLDMVDKDTPDPIYPFAAIDTVNNHVTIQSIKEMIIENVVRSGLYDDQVDPDALFNSYEKNIVSNSRNNKIVELYHQIQQLKPGNPAPDFGTLKNVNGLEKSIADFKGENILLTAWGTWCPYCKEELPHIKKLMKKHEGKFKNLAISLDKDPKKWHQYLADENWGATHLIDPDKGSTFRKNYLISGTNVHYLIDRKGMILSSRLKPSSDELKTLMEDLK